MYGMLDGLVVGVAIVVSVVYAALSLGPKALRRRTLLGAAVVLRKLPGALRLQAAALRLEAAAQKAGGACGGCESCGSTQPAKTGRDGDEGSGNAGSTEVRIPISTIRHRK